MTLREQRRFRSTVLCLRSVAGGGAPGGSAAHPRPRRSRQPCATCTLPIRSGALRLRSTRSTIGYNHKERPHDKAKGRAHGSVNRGIPGERYLSALDFATLKWGHIRLSNATLGVIRG